MKNAKVKEQSYIYIYTVHCMKVQFSIIITDTTSTVIVMLVCKNRQLSIIMVSEPVVLISLSRI